MKNVTFVFVAALLISGCAAPIQPQTNGIIASPYPAPKSCKYVGQIVGDPASFITDIWASKRDLELGAMIDLKNQANRMGANYIQLILSRDSKTGAIKGYPDYIGDSRTQSVVMAIANAYVCSYGIIGLQ